MWRARGIVRTSDTAVSTPERRRSARYRSPRARHFASVHPSSARGRRRHERAITCASGASRCSPLVGARGDGRGRRQHRDGSAAVARAAIRAPGRSREHRDGQRVASAAAVGGDRVAGDHQELDACGECRADISAYRVTLAERCRTGRARCHPGRWCARGSRSVSARSTSAAHPLSNTRWRVGVHSAVLYHGGDSALTTTS